MVLSWVTEPSTEQGRAGPVVPDATRSAKFAESVRFRRDGTSKISNFLNGRDGEGRELSPTRRDGIDTNTHTTYADRLATAARVLALADDVSSQLWSAPTLKSQRVKSATNKTLLSNDTRFEVLREPYAEPLGPGEYWIEAALPGVGTLPRDLPSRSASPSRDPTHASASFTSPPRPPRMFTPTEGPDRTYIGNDFMPINDKAVAWSTTSDKRPDVVDYRSGARFSEARKEVPIDAEYEASATMDRSGRSTRLADKARTANTAGVAFNTRESRFASLPRARHNDTRLGRQRSDEDPAALGPGTYSPLISIGAARRSTYRLFGPKAPAGIIGYGAIAGATHSGTPPTSTRGGQLQGATSSFVGTPRSRKYGPFTWKTDSQLTRTI